MATKDDGIRLQAERVVRAYRELRADTNSAKFKSDDFPVGLFAELVQQIKLLDDWLEPAEQPASDLKARCEALGYQLYVTTEGTQLVVDDNAERSAREVIFIHEDDEDDDLEEWIADREQVSARVRQTTRLSPLDLRRAAENVIKLYRDDSWDALAGEGDGGYKPLTELEERLGELETALDVETDAAEVLGRPRGPNEALADALGKRVDLALLCIETARRFTEICAASVEALETEHSGDVAFTMNGELWGALEDARKALEGKAS